MTNELQPEPEAGVTTTPVHSTSASPKNPRFSLAAPAWLSRLGVNSERQLSMALMVFAAACWFLPRAYLGIRHDGMLYLAQSLMQVWPNVFKADLFFAYGSQDQYSIYSTLYVWLATHFGWSSIAPVLLIVCQIAFLCGLALLLCKLVPRPLAALGVALASASPYYGGFAIFSFGEGFMTARSVAEPLVLFAMWSWFNERRLLSALLLALAMLLHPLLALAGVGIVLVLVGETRPRLFWLLLLIPLAFLLGVLGVPGFEVLIHRYDDVWWNALGPNVPAFPQFWRTIDYTKCIFDAVVLFVCGRLATGKVARFVQAALLVAVVGMLASMVGGEIFRLVLVSQAQFWRAQWFAHLLACGLFPWLIWRLRDQGPYAWIGLALLFFSIVFRAQSSAIYAPLAGGLALIRSSMPNRPITRAFRTFVLVAVPLIIVAGLVNEVTIAEFLGLSRGNESELGFFQRLFEFPLVTLTFMLGAVMLASSFPRVALGTAVVCFVTSLAIWDQRNEWSTYIEDNIAHEHPFARSIPETAQVYWPGDLQAPWFILKRASYFTQAQASGVIFNRQTALEFQRRSDVVGALETESELCRKIGSLLGSCTPGLEVLEEVCSAAGPPDFIVLPAKLEGRYRDVWDLNLKEGWFRGYYLYECAEINRQAKLRPLERT